jgi:hypothetical protein
MSIKQVISTLVVSTLVAAGGFILMPQSVSAWSVNNHASSECKDEEAIINWVFKNKEPNQAKWSIDLEVSNTLTDTVIKKTVTPGQQVTGTFYTGQSKINESGKVSFKMLWTDGRNGVDTRQSNFHATEECVTPEEPAFNANVVCAVVDKKAIYTLRVVQTAGDVDGVFSPANGTQLPNVDAVEVLGIFESGDNVKKIVVTTEAATDCTPEEEKEIKVCRDGKIITINENDKRDSDTTVCKEEPKVLSEVTELPKTGAGSLIAVVGAVFAGGTTLSQIRLRRKNQ